MMDRRRFLAAAGAGLGGAMLGSGCAPRTVGGPFSQAYVGLGEILPDEPSLAQIARRAGVLYGAAVISDHLYGDPPFAAAVARECDVIVAEGEMKWVGLRPTPDTFDFRGADRLVAFARDHELAIRGHTLVWHYVLPEWFPEVMTPANAERRLRDHIETVVGRYAGSIHSWDVVNEAIFPGDGLPRGMRRSEWLDLIGPEYVELAFHMAAEADPNAILVYNEALLDYATREHQDMRSGVLDLLERLVSRDVPVHALGVQAHLWAEERRFNPGRLQKFLIDVGEMGLQIFITEMDVSDQGLPTDPRERDATVASVYRDYLQAVLEVPQVNTVITWGLSDRYTWLEATRPLRDGQPVRPLPLDADYGRKAAWRAMADAFDRRLGRLSN